MAESGNPDLIVKDVLIRHLIASGLGVIVPMIVLIALASGPETALFSWAAWGPTLLTLLVLELAVNFIVLWNRFAALLRSTRNPLAWIPPLEKSSGLSEKLRSANFNFCAVSSKDPALWRSATFLFYLQDNATKSLTEMSRYFQVPIVFSRNLDDKENYIRECREAVQAIAAGQDPERFIGIRLMVYDSSVLRTEERALGEIINLHARGGMYCIPVAKDVLWSQLLEDAKRDLDEFCRRIDVDLASGTADVVGSAVPDFLVIDNHSQATLAGDSVWWAEHGDWKQGRSSRDCRTARELFAVLCKGALQNAILAEFNVGIIDAVAIPSKAALIDRFFSLPYFGNWLERSGWQFQDWFKEEEALLRELVRDVPNDFHVLDVGCGEGRHMKLLAATGAQVHGIDNNGTMSQRATEELEGDEKLAGRVHVHQYNARRMYFPPNTFNLVVCMTNTLGNMPGIEKDVLQEIDRVLKPGGKAILSVYSDSKDVSDLRAEAYAKVGLHVSKVTDGSIETREGLLSRGFSSRYLQTLCKSSGLQADVRQFTRLGLLCEATKPAA
jgi:SAM-dependent methyltransferase